MRPDHPEAYCAWCDHHADDHTYTARDQNGDEIPCKGCPDGVCRRP